MGNEPILKIEKPDFIVKLHENLLQVDLKQGARKKLEDALEIHPALRESLGILFQTIIPLDVALDDIDSTEIDKKGRLKIIIPMRKDLVIPLEREESKKLAEKLNELIPVAKLKEAQKVKQLEELEKRRRPGPREPT
jgi:hypothetical protein